MTTTYEESPEVLKATFTLKPGASAPHKDAISTADYYPATCFLAPLTGEPSAWYTDQQAFFGQGSLEDPQDLSLDAHPRLLPPDAPGTSDA